jgi:hypothetical protein
MKQNRTKKLAYSILVVAVFAGTAIAAVPHNFVTGETLTAANLNTNFNDLDGRLIALSSQVAALETPVATSRRYVRATPAAQTLTAGALSAIDFNALAAVTAFAADFDLGADNFAPKLAGVYALTASVASDDWKGARPTMQLVCNSTTLGHNSIVASPTSGVGSQTIRGTWVVAMAVGDTCQVRVNPTNAGTPVPVDNDPSKTFFEAMRIGN